MQKEKPKKTGNNHDMIRIFFSFDMKENDHAELTLRLWQKCVARMNATGSQRLGLHWADVNQVGTKLDKFLSR